MINHRTFASKQKSSHRKAFPANDSKTERLNQGNTVRKTAEILRQNTWQFSWRRTIVGRRFIVFETSGVCWWSSRSAKNSRRFEKSTWPSSASWAPDRAIGTPGRRRERKSANWFETSTVYATVSRFYTVDSVPRVLKMQWKFHRVDSWRIASSRFHLLVIGDFCVDLRSCS